MNRDDDDVIDTPQGDAERVNILLVDDRPENLSAMRRALKSPFYEVIGVRSGAEALRCLLRDEFALILLDVRMPEMDGFKCTTKSGSSTPRRCASRT
jgi:CheY-like chemotaxis protein